MIRINQKSHQNNFETLLQSFFPNFSFTITFFNLCKIWDALLYPQELVFVLFNAIFVLHLDVSMRYFESMRECKTQWLFMALVWYEQHPYTNNPSYSFFFFVTKKTSLIHGAKVGIEGVWLSDQNPHCTSIMCKRMPIIMANCHRAGHFSFDLKSPL